MKKPKVKLVGQNGNIFNLAGIASLALKKKKYFQEDSEMKKRILAAKSYEEALAIICEYVEAR